GCEYGKAEFARGALWEPRCIQGQHLRLLQGIRDPLRRPVQIDNIANGKLEIVKGTLDARCAWRDGYQLDAARSKGEKVADPRAHDGAFGHDNGACGGQADAVAPGRRQGPVPQEAVDLRCRRLEQHRVAWLESRLARRQENMCAVPEDGMDIEGQLLEFLANKRRSWRHLGRHDDDASRAFIFVLSDCCGE